MLSEAYQRFMQLCAAWM